jgi:hypothetical protein
MTLGVLGFGSVLLGVVSSPAVAATGTWSTPAITLSAAGGSANSPQVSVNAAGTAVAVWTRSNGSNNIVQSASSTDGGVNWSTPANLSASGRDAFSPQISVNAAGNAVAVWTRYDDSNYIVQSASSTDGGVTWSPTVSNLSAVGGSANSPQISVNAAGTAVAVWTRGDGSSNIVQSVSSTNGGVTWSPTVSNLSAVGGDAQRPQISLNAAGTAVAVWTRGDGSNIIVQSASSNNGGVTWSPTVEDLSPALGDEAGSPQISLNAAGTAVAVWTRYDDGSNTIVQSASSTNGGVTWSPTVSNLSAVGGDAQRPQISLNAAGTAVAVWTRGDGSNNIVQSVSSTNGGVTWSTPVNDLSAVGANGDEPQISLNAEGTAIAIWRRYDGSNNIVQSVSSTNGGVTWSTPVNNLSAVGGDAEIPEISLNSGGTAIAVWRRFDGSDLTVQTSSLTLPSSANSPSLANTGATPGAAATTVGVVAGLLTAGALALVLLRRRLASR